jgi:hypothetical protein
LDVVTRISQTLRKGTEDISELTCYRKSHWSADLPTHTLILDSCTYKTLQGGHHRYWNKFEMSEKPAEKRAQGCPPDLQVNSSELRTKPMMIDNLGSGT